LWVATNYTMQTIILRYSEQRDQLDIGISYNEATHTFTLYSLKHSVAPSKILHATIFVKKCITN
jgi:hypothetical protein